MKKILLLFFAVVGLSMTISAKDVVFLKDGRAIKGEIIEFIPGLSLKIETPEGCTFDYSMSNVERVGKEKDVKQKGIDLKISENGLSRGYKCFFDIGYNVQVEEGCDVNLMQFTTSHGYQFNPYFYLGGGLSFYLNVTTASERFNSIPIFANVRITPLKRSITPFLDVKVGYDFNLYDNHDHGFYFAPTIGYRSKVSEKLGLNMGVGFYMRNCPRRSYDSHRKDYYLSFSVGVDF